MTNHLCKFCNKQLKNINSHKNHVLRCNKNPDKILQGICKNNVEQDKLLKQQYDNNPKKCKCCKTTFSFSEKRKTFCNRSCAAKYNNANRTMKQSTKNKISNTLKLNNIKNPKICKPKQCICVNCNKSYFTIKYNYKLCSNECKSELLSKTARKNIHLGIKRSKDEIELYNLLNNHFNNVFPNKKIIDNWDCDIALDDYKIAILWNGPWHYKEMNFGNHSLKQVQNRDKIKLKKFTEHGWNVIIFEDRHYTPNTAFQYIKNMVGRVGIAPTTVIDAHL